ncbi:MAG: SCO family protein [Rhodospirillaceae bacterium]|jgi:protein SCO1/2|nr:SCO family protein [Rhodospirillaceae bacterium]MBT4045441.1 SCO family protein [Rhodospirillaceae bacterium]MBT4688153.1 SCO family protein [Rhodospirillaceae bacterium]MBT5081903.1 SCO family protein [Rhodospirillaceae bacterium]MBT5523639.1 SCO family protein [Rhodospirillaceae bacterium]
MNFSRVMLFIAATVIAVALGLIVNALFLDEDRPAITSTGVASIGGSFELLDHTGKAVQDSDFREKYMLVFFGYTSCPDVCPTELQVITEAMDRLGDDADKVVPMMITIDPERDTAAVLADYMENFHPRLLGLTGDLAQIKAVGKAYRVYFAKTKPDEEGDYFMDHSSFVYVMGPDGKYLHHFAPNAGAEVMADKMREIMSGS